MAHRLTLLVWFILFAHMDAAPVHAEKRVALVIGNATYQSAAKLANPLNDASDVSAVLKELGFQVIEGFDLEKVTFDRKVRDFAAALQGAAAGIFFYAGHGLQVAGHNYLVPIDAQLTTAAALEFEMVRVDVVQRVMENQANTNILVLDACRDNPLARNLARALGTRSAEIGRGLAPVVSGVGTLISFSTQPGNVALDGGGRNSPFAGALVKHILAAQDDLSAILISVRNDVMRETDNRQVPWEHSALRGRFYFRDARPAAGVAPSAWQLSERAEAWDRAKDTTSIAALELFITRYKDTYYADLARLRIQELSKQQLAVAAPSPQRKPGDKAGAIEAEANTAAQARRDAEEGDRYYFGRGVPRDYVKAREAYERAATAGHPGGMSGLGWLYESGLGVASDQARARELYEKAATRGHAIATNNLGRMYREGQGGLAQDYAKARELHEKAAAAGNLDALVSLGWLHHNGWGVPLDYRKAREFYEKASTKGNDSGMNNLGILYLDGLGVERNQAKARDLFERAAAAGNDFAMNNLGRVYQNGWGVPQDYIKAREWFEKSTASGNRFAKANLAKLLDEGKGGVADFARAAKLMLDSARSGNNALVEDLQSDMKKWSKETRIEVKRELARLGYYKGPLNDTWDGSAYTALGKYLAK
jgi:TPR repeat protein